MISRSIKSFQDVEDVLADMQSMIPFLDGKPHDVLFKDRGVINLPHGLGREYQGAFALDGSITVLPATNKKTHIKLAPSSAWEMRDVFNPEEGVNVADFTFEIDAEVGKEYRIDYDWHTAGGTNVDLTMRPVDPSGSAISANQKTSWFSVSNATANNTTTTLRIGFASLSNNMSHGWAEMWLAAGDRRSLNWHCNGRNASYAFSRKGTGVWDDTSTIVKGIKVIAGGSTNIGAASEFRLYSRAMARRSMKVWVF